MACYVYRDPETFLLQLIAQSLAGKELVIADFRMFVNIQGDPAVDGVLFFHISGNLLSGLHNLPPYDFNTK
jgi:hypothetical protein